MLKIRHDQIEALGRPLEQRFVQDVVDHVRENFPEESAGHGEHGLLDLIISALERARAHGLRAERDLLRYVNVAMIYGVGFEDHTDTAWTRAYLEDEDVPDPGQRIQRLHEAVILRLRAEERSMA